MNHGRAAGQPPVHGVNRLRRHQAIAGDPVGTTRAMASDTGGERSGGTWAFRVLYWLAVIAVSVALVALLLVLLYSRDDATVGALTSGGV